MECLNCIDMKMVGLLVRKISSLKSRRRENISKEVRTTRGASTY